MTAMSDVTVLLLTFFMLTSTFVKKEPVTVRTPDSVSEIKIPETDILQILMDKEGRVYLSMDKQTDQASYANLIDLLDEMQVCSIGRYVITDLTEGDQTLLAAANSMDNPLIQ